MTAKRFGEYADKGNYHIDLDPNWPYLPVYLAKLEAIRSLLDRRDPRERGIDLGCGEGVLVQEYRGKGYNLIGMDANYEAAHVVKGSLLQTGYEDASFDLVLCLDVLEHLSFAEQEQALAEIARLLRPGGTFIMSIPNLAHLASRLSFLVRGKLIRTSSIDRHPGDRPVGEYLRLLEPSFRVERRRGIFPTLPLLSLLTVWKPSASIPLHRLYNRLLAVPGWCFLNILTCTRK